MRRLLVIGVIVGVVVALAASGASAHDATITSDCAGFSVSFTSFPDGQNTATVNGETVTWTGSSHTETFVHPVFLGDPDFPIEVTWTADGGGSASGVQSSTDCEEPPTTTTTTTLESETVSPPTEVGGISVGELELNGVTPSFTG